MAHLGTGDFSLLDHDEGRGDQGALSYIVDRVVGHWLQQVDGFLWKDTIAMSLEMSCSWKNSRISKMLANNHQVPAKVDLNLMDPNCKH